MIVWLASFPRSGNTFLRIVLHEQYGVATYSGLRSGDDLQLDGRGANPTGHAALPAALSRALIHDRAGVPALLEEMDAAPEIYFIKTHATNQETFGSRHRAILLVRDGRDAFVSYVWHLLRVRWSRRRLAAMWRGRLGRLPQYSGPLHPVVDQSWPRFLWNFGVVHPLGALTTNLARRAGAERLLFRAVSGWRAGASSYWGELNESWLDRPGAWTVVLRYEDLVARPREAVAAALETLEVRLPEKGTEISTFEELQRLHPDFFRRGRSGEGREVLTPKAREAFEKANQRCMARLGYR
jgi:hypothetical protein